MTPTRPRGRKRREDPDALPTRRPRHLTRSRGRETPGGEKPLGTDEAGEVTTVDLEGIPGTKPQGLTGPPDPKTSEDKVGETA